MTEHPGRNTVDAAPAGCPGSAPSPQTTVRDRHGEAVPLPSIPGFCAGAEKADPEPGLGDPREALEQAFRRLLEIVGGAEDCPAGT